MTLKNLVLPSLTLAVVMVPHNLAVASYMSDQIMVMCQGQMVKRGARDQIIETPSHEYTRELFQAVPQYFRLISNCPMGSAGRRAVSHGGAAARHGVAVPSQHERRTAPALGHRQAPGLGAPSGAVLLAFGVSGIALRIKKRRQQGY